MNQKKKNTYVTLFIFSFFVIGTCLGFVGSVKAEKIQKTILNEGFETGIPSDWTNTGWLLNYYGSAHNGSGWMYSWAAGDALTTKTVGFGDNTSLSFWYASENGNPMSLEVYLDDAITSNLLWSDIGFTHKQYSKVTIDLYEYTGNHQIVIVGNTSDLYGQLLDDIVITSYVEEEDNGGSGNGGGGTPPGENIPPVADLSQGEPYQGYTNGSIFFDASLSYDPDGSIVKWFWFFGDGTTKNGEQVYHTYENPGTYNVTLHVVDDDDAEVTDTAIVQIQKGNHPPSKPVVKSTLTLPELTNIFLIKDKDNEASFTVSSEDLDGDSFYFIIDWGDDTIETTEIIDSSSRIDVNHSWKKEGRYDIRFIAKDDQNASSEETQIMIFMNIGTISIKGAITGYLIDYSNAENYTHFYNKNLDLETTIEQDEMNQYLIDSDGDQEWDYTYNETSGLVAYQSDKNDDSGKDTSETPGFEIILFSIAIIFVLLRRKIK